MKPLDKTALCRGQLDQANSSQAALHNPDFEVSPAADPVGPPETVNFDAPTPGETADYLSEEASTVTAAATKRIAIPGYELLGVLGRGGMGIVYQARQIKADRIVALKLMLHADHADSIARERFDTEAQAVARLQHPNIVQVFEVGEVDGTPFFTLEFVPGGSLAKKIKHALLPPKDTARLMHMLGAAIAFAHRERVVHRDLKPDNVLLTADGTPKIADFGLARKLEADNRVTRAGTIFGTPSYMSPEQADGDMDAIGPAADIYSLGAVLYELLTGRPPFVGDNMWETIAQVRKAEPVAPRLLRPATPRDLETICLKCLQKDAAKRYGTAEALSEDLQRYLDGRPILARPTGAVERTVRWCRRYPWPTAAMTILAAAVIATTLALVHIDQQRTEIKLQKVVAEDRLQVYRKSVNTFVNEMPALGENVPLAGAVRRESLELVMRMLEQAQGKADVGAATEHGVIAIEIRKGDLATSRHEYDQAQEHYLTARRLAEQALHANPVERDKATGNLATAIAELAQLATTRRRHDEAIHLREECVTLRRQVVEKPASGEIQSAQAKADLGKALARLGEALRNKGQSQAALDAIREGISFLEHAQDGTLTGRKAEQAKRDLALATVDLAQVLIVRQQPDEARKAYARACSIFREMIQASSTNVTPRLNLAKTAAEFGDWLLVDVNDAAEAAKYYAQSQEQYRVVLTDPDLVNLQQAGEALGYYRQGTAAVRSGKTAESLPYFKRCLDLREKRWRDLEDASEPKSRTEAQRFQIVDAKIERMLAQARCGLHAEAAVTAENIMLKLVGNLKPAPPGSDRRPMLCLQAGCGFALCAAAAPPKEREPYLTKSVAAIASAIKLGYKNLVFLERDPDLDPVRNLSSYQELIARLKK